jgi:site-specific recombinase XerD
MDEISIMDVDLDFVGAVTLNEVYEYLAFLARDRIKNPRARDTEYGLTDAARARKVATIRSFYKYLTVKTKLLSKITCILCQQSTYKNPIHDIDSPKGTKALPRYLRLDESIRLLNAVDGKNRERDYCILSIFLNCGLRISEIVGLNLSDVRIDHLRVLGKGNKERIVFLNDGVIGAINDYLTVRKTIAAVDRNALFLSNRRTRMSRETVHSMVKNTLLKAGLDREKYSAHKLRHTAATLMLQNGVDVRTLQEILGHEHLNTTQIYTHVDNAELRMAAQANPLSKIKTKK